MRRQNQEGVVEQPFDRLERGIQPDVGIREDESLRGRLLRQQVRCEERLHRAVQFERGIALDETALDYARDAFDFQHFERDFGRRDSAVESIAKTDHEAPVGVVLLERLAQRDRTGEMIEGADRAGDRLHDALGSRRRCAKTILLR